MTNPYYIVTLNIPERSVSIGYVFYMHRGLLNSTSIESINPLRVFIRSDFEGEVTVVYVDGEQVRTTVSNHPWLTNLRDMMKMLNDEIKVPHSTHFETEPIGQLPCDECTRAYELRAQYLSVKQRGVQ